jgi:hypothetical protein
MVDYTKENLLGPVSSLLKGLITQFHLSMHYPIVDQNTDKLEFQYPNSLYSILK